MYGDTPAAARRARNARLAELGDPSTQARRRGRAGVPTLRAWASEWLAAGLTAAGRPMAPRTVETYREHLATLDRRWGGVPLDQLDGHAVTEWVRAHFGEARARAHGCQAALRSCVGAAIRARRLDVKADPFAGVARLPEPPTKVKAGRTSKAWSQDEVTRLLAAATELDARARTVKLRPALVVMLGTGVRPGELLGLEARHVDRAAGQLVIEQQRGGAPLKTRSSARTLRVSGAVVEALDELAEDGARHLIRAGYDGLRDRLVTACELAGVPYLGLHAARHTAATAWLTAGVPLPSVSARLGHSSTRETAETYAHALPHGDQLALDALDLG